jgi:hypothetical protein
VQSNLADFIDEPQNADLQLLNRPRISENISQLKMKNIFEILTISLWRLFFNHGKGSGFTCITFFPLIFLNTDVGINLQ